MESWDAKSDKEFAFFFEDDIEVASRYFEYTIIALNKYVIPNGQRTTDSKLADRFFGISLYTPRYNEIGLTPTDWTPSEVIGEESLYIHQLPCSWGSLLIPWRWREFLEFYQWRRSKEHPSLKASVPDTAVQGWRRSWKKFLIEFMYMRGSYMLYPSLPSQVSFSTHHREPGEHTRATAEDPLVDELGTMFQDFFTVPLVGYKDGAHVDRLFAEMQPLSRLPVLTFHHKRVQDVHSLVQLGQYTVDLMVAQGWNHDRYTVNRNCILDTVTFPVAHTQDVGEKYLVYEPQLSLGHQLNALQNAAAYAKILGRTLVIPPLIVSNNASIKIDLDRVVQVEKWGFVKMISLAELTRDHDGWIDRIVQFVPWSLHDKSMMKMTDDLLYEAGLIPSNQAILHVIPTSEQEITKQFGGCRDKVLAFRHLFGSFTSFTTPAYHHEYRDWISKMRIAKPIKDWTTQTTGVLGNHLICMEFGRGDDPADCGVNIKEKKNATETDRNVLNWNCEADLPSTIGHLMEELKKNNISISTLYIITDSPRPSGSYPFKVSTLPDISMLVPRELRELHEDIKIEIARLVEMEMCSTADLFIGNAYSSLSRRIIDKRGTRRSAFLGEPIM